jgi:hypothetical protein
LRTRRVEAGPCEVCMRRVADMSVQSKIEASIRDEDHRDLVIETRLKSLKPIALLFLALEVLPILINYLHGMTLPFFSPLNMNVDPHVYHHIHFLVYGFPIGLSVWFIMDWRVRELERQLVQVSPITGRLLHPKVSPGACLARRMTQGVLFFAFWFGWDDLKFHYLSRHWSLVHEILQLFR